MPRRAVFLGTNIFILILGKGVKELNIPVNYWAVLVSAIASMAVGSIWYGPLFGKKFSSVMGFDKMSAEQRDAMKKSMAMTYVWQFIASVVMFYVLAWFVGATGFVTLMGGVQIALLVWIGVVVPLALGNSLWGGKMAMFWLSAGNMLVTLAVAGAIIGAWR